MISHLHMRGVIHVHRPDQEALAIHCLQGQGEYRGETVRVRMPQREAWPCNAQLGHACRRSLWPPFDQCVFYAITRADVHTIRLPLEGGTSLLQSLITSFLGYCQQSALCAVESWQDLDPCTMIRGLHSLT